MHYCGGWPCLDIYRFIFTTPYDWSPKQYFANKASLKLQSLLLLQYCCKDRWVTKSLWRSVPFSVGCQRYVWSTTENTNLHKVTQLICFMGLHQMCMRAELCVANIGQIFMPFQVTPYGEYARGDLKCLKPFVKTTHVCTTPPDLVFSIRRC